MSFYIIKYTQTHTDTDLCTEVIEKAGTTLTPMQSMERASCTLISTDTRNSSLRARRHILVRLMIEENVAHTAEGGEGKWRIAVEFPDGPSRNHLPSFDHPI